MQYFFQLIDHYLLLTAFSMDILSANSSALTPAFSLRELEPVTSATFFDRSVWS